MQIWCSCWPIYFTKFEKGLVLASVVDQAWLSSFIGNNHRIQEWIPFILDNWYFVIVSLANLLFYSGSFEEDWATRTWIWARTRPYPHNLVEAPSNQRRRQCHFLHSIFCKPCTRSEVVQRRKRNWELWWFSGIDQVFSKTRCIESKSDFSWLYCIDFVQVLTFLS